MSSSGSYGGLKGISRSLTNPNQSWIKRFVSNSRIEWYQSDWNPTKNDRSVLEKHVCGRRELIYRLTLKAIYRQTHIAVDKAL